MKLYIITSVFKLKVPVIQCKILSLFLSRLLGQFAKGRVKAEDYWNVVWSSHRVERMVCSSHHSSFHTISMKWIWYEYYTFRCEIHTFVFAVRVHEFLDMNSKTIENNGSLECWIINFSYSYQNLYWNKGRVYIHHSYCCMVCYSYIERACSSLLKATYYS